MDKEINIDSFFDIFSSRRFIAFMKTPNYEIFKADINRCLQRVVSPNSTFNIINCTLDNIRVSLFNQSGLYLNFTIEIENNDIKQEIDELETQIAALMKYPDKQNILGNNIKELQPKLSILSINTKPFLILFLGITVSINLIAKHP